MTTIRLRGSIFHRMVQRPSIASHTNIEESKYGSQRNLKRQKLVEGERGEFKFHKNIPERMRSKSEVGLSYPSPQKHAGKYSVLKKYSKKNSYWAKVKVTKQSHKQDNLKIVIGESMKRLLAVSNNEMVISFGNVKST